MSDNINIAAKKLLQSYDSGIPIKAIRSLLPDDDIKAAYAVQKLNTDHWVTHGREPIGHKIGLTSKSVQNQLGVDQPDFGILYSDMAISEHEEIRTAQVMQPKVEAEIAFVLEKDLNQKKYTIADIINAVAYILPAIEIVGSRIEAWDINIVDTIADNASSGLFVLGNSPKQINDIDMRLCGMVMERRGEQVSLGAGQACLGNPLNAVVWLANKMAEFEQPLIAGDIILSGALGPMVTASPGDIFEARISGLGSVTASFANGDK
ncbi:MAG: fumarylacetoacetate hydrolase family protein [Emcibacteraceae bacterium]|nr:fumarylacetoacetate hydrolase family protein [Emcibacteraceae bacterium]